jgi:hypothetical protein
MMLLFLLPIKICTDEFMPNDDCHSYCLIETLIETTCVVTACL